MYERLARWRYCEIAEYATVLDGKVFVATWRYILANYYNVYD